MVIVDSYSRKKGGRNGVRRDGGGGIGGRSDPASGKARAGIVSVSYVYPMIISVSQV